MMRSTYDVRCDRKPSGCPGEQNPGAGCCLDTRSRHGDWTGVVSRLRRRSLDRRGVRAVNVSDSASSGLTGLDDILGGGFVLGCLHLVEGKAGTGKTTLGMQ